MGIGYSQWWSQRFVQVAWKVTLVWCMVEDQQWKGNDKKVKIGGIGEYQMSKLIIPSQLKL